MLIAYSSERRELMRTQIGSANYSYIFIEDAFTQLLRRREYDVAYVTNPEIFKTGLAYSALLGRDADDVIHIAFRSTENIRIMAGAYNVCHFAWEFDVLKDRGLAIESLLRNQVHMLRLVDEIWVGCTYTQEVLARYGLGRTTLMPAPLVGLVSSQRIGWPEALKHLSTIAIVPLAFAGAWSREENAALSAALMDVIGDHAFFGRRCQGASGNLFLSVLAPGDRRKNLLNLIEGFQLAAGPDDLLLIKLAVSNQGEFRTHAIFDALSPLYQRQVACDDERIAFVMDYLSDDEMGSLFSIADFYLCASHCEGFNLPLLQSMALGTVPVTTRNTAMLDYVDDGNALIVREKQVVSPVENMAGDIAGTLYSIGVASRFDIAAAVRRARALSAEERNILSERARCTVLEKYGERQVEANFRQWLGEIELRRRSA